MAKQFRHRTVPSKNGNTIHIYQITPNNHLKMKDHIIRIGSIKVGDDGNFRIRLYHRGVLGISNVRFKEDETMIELVKMNLEGGGAMDG